MGCCQANNNVKRPTLNKPIKEVNTNQSGTSKLTPNIQQNQNNGPHLNQNQNGQISNLQNRIDTPHLTEENPLGFDNNNLLNVNQSKSKIINVQGQNKKVYQYFDISPKVIKKNKIYHITNVFPVHKPYSNWSEWQKLLLKSFQISEDDQVQQILNLRNRNWIQEQIKLQIETSNLSTGSLEGFVIHRRFLQLREHFNWLVWAVAQFYFSQKYENKYNLPKFNNRKWFDGFEFKGTFIRVLPYEEAYFIRNEMVALKYVQMELLELQTLAPILTQQYSTKINSKDHLQKDVILPLLSGVSCGGFYLFGSPIIYMQELEITKDFYKEAANNLNQSRMQAIQNQSLNLSFSYLHNNINPDFVSDSIFKFMPIMKNISSQNMIPIIDFEEFNEREGTDDQKMANLELKYLFTNLYDILPRLSETSVSTLLIKFPCFITEDLSFHAFPKSNYMEVNEIRKLINQQQEAGKIKSNEDKDEVNNGFTKNFFQKHGWDFIMIQQSGVVMNENKRASAFYSQREIPLRANGTIILADPSQQTGANINQIQQSASQIKGVEEGALINAQQQNFNIIDDYQSVKSVVDQQQNLFKEEARYLSPQKQSILRKMESINENGNNQNKIHGNALVAGYNYKKDFKIQYSLNGHTYSTNLESLFSASIDQVAKIIEQSDTIYNVKSLKELMHRKGLNMRFEWIVLAKLRINQFREIVMIDILLRTMRKIVNEETKLKSKVLNTQMLDGNQAQINEFYQGNQLDIYKETLVFYISTILQKKFCKQKLVFDETLLGLFLSRMAILGILFSLNLQKEEIIYLESKQILEDIIETPCKNPILFINSVQTYFNLEFKPDFLRICRQDKFIMLSKAQPITVNDIKSVKLHTNFYFSIKEYSYFMLARSITHHSKNSPQKSQNKVKTKVEKDILKQSFQKPKGVNFLNDSMQTNHSFRNEDNPLNNSRVLNSGTQNISNSNTKSGGTNNSMLPQGKSNNNNNIGNGSNRAELSKTARNDNQNQLNKDQQLSTIRQYKNMDKEIDKNIKQNQKKDLNLIEEFSSPPINAYKLGKLGDTNNSASKQEMVDLSKLSKRSNFKPTQVQEIIMPSILYKLKTYLSSNPIYYFDDNSKTFVGDTFTVLKSYYEMPDMDIVNEWVICMESLLKDVVSVSGSEQVLLEAFVYQAILIYFFEKDPEGLLKVLTKIRDTLFTISYCSPETLMVIQILTGFFFEEQTEQFAIVEAEKNYLTALLCILSMYGDPRGRGNIAVPYTLFLSWKLSLLSLSEDRKLHDSEFAEEIFDGCLRSLYNHKRLYREQQLQQYMPTTQLQKGGLSFQPVQTPRTNNNVGSVIEQQWFSQYEIEMENQELKKQIFDIKKYKTRQTIGVKGVIKVNQNYHPNSVIKPVQQNNKQAKQDNINIKDKQSNQKRQYLAVEQPIKEEQIKSKSQVPGLSAKNQKNKANNYQVDNGDQHEIEISEIDLEIEDENKHFFIEENFKNNEWYVGTIPFQHWSLYRQQIAQILQAHSAVLNKNNNQTQIAQYQKQIYKEMLQKSLAKDVFYQWMLKFNSIMYQCGIQWSNQQIKETIFCQNQQMISSSSSSVVVSNNHHLTHQSSSMGSQILNTPSSNKEKRGSHLGSYSQILGKEGGGINKQEMYGVVFSWGSESNGQLGQNIVQPTPQQTDQNNGSTQQQFQYNNLKVLYPRMIISLRDEIIKDICCGHSHTLAININGAVFSWGFNEQGQLGLGPEAPNIIRKPIMNPYLSNIIKLSAGNEHSLALTKTNELYTWGAGGLTGQGDLKKVTIPTKMEFFSKTKVMIAVCGGLHTIAVNKEGETYSWGSTEGGQLGLPQQMIVNLCQGKEQPVLSPQRIPKLTPGGLQQVQLHVSQIACGEAHSIAMTKDGIIYGWGMSNYGQLGLGFSSDSFEPGVGMEKSKRYEPEEITGLKNEKIDKIYCGATFTLFLTNTGDLYGCGMNDLGQLGLDTFMDDVQALEKMKKGKHQQTSDVNVPTKIICFQGISLFNIACGESHALAVSGDDKNMLWAWGMYKNGQLGLGEVTMKMNPRPVQSLCSSQIQKIACGSLHSVALIGDSTQISTLSPQYYSNNDVLINYWASDIRGLSFNNFDQKEGLYDGDTEFDKFDQVPDDGEGKIKNPK